MQLRNAASFLMIGSIVLIGHQLIKLFYMLYYGMLFLEGIALGCTLAVIGLLTGIVCLLLSISFRRGAGHSVGRMTTGIFLAIVSGMWAMGSAVSTVYYFEWLGYMGDRWFVIIASHLLFLLSCISLLLLGIALSGNNGLRQRRAYIWVIVCCGSSALAYFGLSVYGFVRDSATGFYLLYVVIELLSLLFPVSCVFLAFSLLRQPGIDELKEGQLDEF